MTCSTMLPKRTFNRSISKYAQMMNDVNLSNHNSVQKYGRANKMTPLTNVIEYEDNFLIQLSIPGYHKDEIDINIHLDTLTIKSTLDTPKEESYIQKEFSKTSFEKNYKLGDSVDKDNIEATIRDGIMSITIAKKEEKKPRSIIVN